MLYTYIHSCPILTLDTPDLPMRYFKGRYINIYYYVIVGNYKLKKVILLYE